MTGISPREPATKLDHATLDEFFDVLSTPLRRRILTALVDANPRAEAELDPADFIGDEQCEGVMMGLHHTHLPKLDEAGVVEWNQGSKTITRGPRFDEIAPFVEVLVANQEELSVSWP